MQFGYLIRIALVVTTTLSLAMMGIRVFSYRAMLRQPGATALLIEVTGLLLLYAAVLYWGAASVSPPLLRPATTIGLIAGSLQAIHIVCERFVNLPGAWNGAATLAFMLTTFILWSLAAFIAARSGQAIPTSIWLAVWSAFVTMTVTVVAGFALEFFVSPTPLDAILSWPEFKRSGWTDVRAFSIANTLDSALSHLLIGPVVAAIVGSGASLLGRASRIFPRHKTCIF
jgi:hypothetical protein